MKKLKKFWVNGHWKFFPDGRRAWVNGHWKSCAKLVKKS